MKQMLRLAVLTRPTEEAIRDGLHAGLRKQSAPLRERLLLRAPAPARPRETKRPKATADKKRRTA
jgi:hypothetical protein